MYIKTICIIMKVNLRYLLLTFNNLPYLSLGRIVMVGPL